MGVITKIQLATVVENFTSNVNGITSTTSLTGLLPTTTNILSLSTSTNILTSTVNGVSATTSLVNLVGPISKVNGNSLFSTGLTGTGSDQVLNILYS